MEQMPERVFTQAGLAPPERGKLLIVQWRQRLDA